MDFFAIIERADRAIHSVAQTHLTEFVGTVDLYPSVGEGDGSRAHGPARESAPHTFPPPCIRTPNRRAVPVFTAYANRR
ncbi:hypothetical protein DU502_16665 [Haloplanus aerogenes]|uniref:Uncharacterized protein n=1 Tax=Haloplanus aerogenes TaxID=660522 RepID=A0A3G8QZK9_9EURY|nr:hypothetical protein DU502_16665 [Haloplanus aerogenes]